MSNNKAKPTFKYDVGQYKSMKNKIRNWDNGHLIPELELENIYSGMDVLLELPSILMENKIGPKSKIVVVVDDTKMIRDNKDLKEQIYKILIESGYDLRIIVLTSDSYGLVHPDFVEVNKVMNELDNGSIVLCIGSGVITDITKHACYTYQKQKGNEVFLVSYMTACSAPAYTSKSSIISKDGVKRTWPSRTPNLIVMDYKTLMDCPYVYSIGGAGDALPAFSAFADWYLAESIGLGEIVGYSWNIDEDVRELLLPYASEIYSKSEDGMEILGKCVHLIGLSMSYANDSVPASGYEHVMSHILDMSAEYDKRRKAVHGQQVGITSILTLIHFEKLIDQLDVLYLNHPQRDYASFFPCENAIKEKVIETFHIFDPSDSMGEECWNDVAIKLDGWNKNKDKVIDFIENWPKHKKSLKKYLVKTAQECTEALETLKHPLYFEELNVPISNERGKWAMKNANLMRKRFTSADLAFFFGWLDDQWIEDVFNRYEKLIIQARARN